MNADQPSQENYREEYGVVSEGYRFFVSIRFITAAFAMSIQSALFTFYNQATKESHLSGQAILIVAMIFLGAMLIVEWRTTFLFRSLLRRGTELEFHLGLPNGFFHRIAELSAQKGFRSFITHTWGINLVYFGVFVLWIMLFIANLTK